MEQRFSLRRVCPARHHGRVLSPASSEDGIDTLRRKVCHETGDAPQAPDATLSRLAQPATAGTATKASSVKKTAVGLDTEEVRIATTMTGGVSLAIWMGGVAREIDLLMQASQFRRALQGGEPDHRTPEPGEIANSAAAQERELYSRLLEFLDIVVEVDILSGTSAGGINAIMLAYARVRNGSLEQLRDIWFEVGALLDLLREPTDSDVPSLLYGDRRMLRALNDELPRLATGTPPRHPPSTTLYVTTTLLTGETGRFTDSLGTLVQDSNHHGLFTFTQKDLIAGGIEGALAVAGRSTASFPGAFEPGFIPCHEATKAAGGIPERPAMGRFINITRSHFCVDGGMTDNQPLDVLLERVFERRASRPVRRVLLFVVPSAGPAADAIAAAPADLISAPYGLLSGLLKDVDAATSQSIGSSLQAILAHNDRFTARTDLRMHLAAMGARLAPHRLLTPRLLADYRTRESTRQARVLVTAMMRLLATWPPQPSPSPTSVGIPPDGTGP
jgi:patatin-related protein